MTTRAQQIENLRRARAMCDGCEPLSREEKIEFQSAKVKVRAEDERKRAPEPQLELAA